jgi:hypothetical protein
LRLSGWRRAGRQSPRAPAHAASRCSGAVLTDEERDKQLVRRLMRSLHNLYHHDHTVPAYGRAALGDGSYATQPGVNAREFRNWLVQYLPDPNNSIGRFVRSTPVLNKKGTKLTEKASRRRRRRRRRRSARR